MDGGHLASAANTSQSVLSRVAASSTGLIAMSEPDEGVWSVPAPHSMANLMICPHEGGNDPEMDRAW